MIARTSAAVVAALFIGCATIPPSPSPEIRTELRTARSVAVKVEYWAGLRDFAAEALKAELTRCGSVVEITKDQASSDLTVHYFHLQAICVDCPRPIAPDSFEVRIIQGNRELVRWARPNVGCGEAECMVKQAMRATAKLLCTNTPPN